MTLLEVLIAITIMSFVSLGLVTLTTGATDTKQRVLQEDQEILQIESALLRIENDLSMLYNPLLFSKKEKAIPPEQMTSKPINDGFLFYRQHARFGGVTEQGFPIPQIKSEEKGQLIFMMNDHKRRIQDSHESAFAWVYYGLQKSGDRQKIGEEETDEKILAPFDLIRGELSLDLYKNEVIDWSREKTYVLLTNLESFEFFFWDEKNKKFQSQLRDIPPTQEGVRTFKVKFKKILQDGTPLEGERLFTQSWPAFDFKKEDGASGKQMPLLPNGGAGQQAGVNPGETP